MVGVAAPRSQLIHMFIAGQWVFFFFFAGCRIVCPLLFCAVLFLPEQARFHIKKNTQEKKMKRMLFSRNRASSTTYVSKNHGLLFMHG